MKKAILTEMAPAPIGPYSQGINALGKFIFVSGQIPFTPEGQLAGETASEQTRQVILNIEAVLKSAGAKLDNVVKTTVFLKNFNDFGAMNEVYAEFFSEGIPPARAAVEVARLPKDVLVEIEAIAVLPE